MPDPLPPLDPAAPPHHQRWFAAADFAARHAAVYDAIGPEAVAVVQGAGSWMRSRP